MILPYSTSPRQEKKLFPIAHFSLRDFTLFSIFFLSLQPYSISWGGGGVSASYFFLLLFIIPARKITLTVSASMYICFFFFIFIAGFPALLFEDPYYLIRTTASFLAFIAPLSLLFIRFKKSDLALFIYAVILSSLYYSINSIESLLYIDPSVGNLKATIGSQRYGFVLCLGFFLAFYEDKMGPFLKAAVLFILLFGMLLTFSRSTIISLSLTFILLVIVSTPKFVSFQKFKLSTFVRLLTMCVLITIATLVFQSELKTLWGFFNTRLILEVLNGSLYKDTLLLNVDSSGGYRLYMLKQIFGFLLYHPFTGSNFSGLYLLFPEYGGVASTHNQYSDVLLRTGLLGFGLWSYLIIKVLKFFRQEKGVLFGLIAILFYGLFHETFKLGQGGFIFGFLLSYQFWLRKQANGSSNNKALLVPR